MPILKNVSVYFAKLNPARPNAKFNAENPTWDLQIRTTDPKVREEWAALSLKPKLLTHTETHENAGEAILTEDGKKQWRVNLRKRSKDSSGKPAAPVVVQNGKMMPIDPDTIGNGSIANVRIYQYESTSAVNPVGTTLMAVQLVRHIVYTRGPSDDDFEMVDTETVEPDLPDTDDDDALAPTTPATKPAATKPAAPALPADDDSAY